MIDDIRQILPIDTMTSEEIAQVMALLDESGITVEIDSGLLTRRSGVVPLDVKPLAEPSSEVERPTAAPDRVLNQSSPGNAATGRGHQELLFHSNASGTIYVVAAILVLLLLVLSIWSFT